MNKNIFGPVSLEDWLYLKMLKQSIDFHKERQKKRWNPFIKQALDKEKKLLEKELSKYYSN